MCGFAFQMLLAISKRDIRCVESRACFSEVDTKLNKKHSWN